MTLKYQLWKFKTPQILHLQYTSDNYEDIGKVLIDIKSLKEENMDLKQKVDDLTNRNMRSNLVFINNPETEGKGFNSTKILLANIIKENLKTEEYYNCIIHAHRSGKIHDNKPRPIICKILHDDLADEIDYKFANLRQDCINHARCSKQYSPAIQARRKQAMLERRRLKETNEIAKAYIKYLATLMIQKPNSVVYVKHKAF